MSLLGFLTAYYIFNISSYLLPEVLNAEMFITSAVLLLCSSTCWVCVYFLSLKQLSLFQFLTTWYHLLTWLQASRHYTLTLYTTLMAALFAAKI